MNANVNVERCFDSKPNVSVPQKELPNPNADLEQIIRKAEAVTADLRKFGMTHGDSIQGGSKAELLRRFTLAAALGSALLDTVEGVKLLGGAVSEALKVHIPTKLEMLSEAIQDSVIYVTGR